MKKFAILLLVVSAFMASCKNDDIEGFEYLDTETLAKNVYVEKYYKSYGVYGGGTQKYFFTDSINVKIYLGNSDDKEYINFTIEGDEIKAEKYTRRNLRNGEVSLISIEYYKIP